MNITERSAENISLETMVVLLKGAANRVHINLEGWLLSREKLIKQKVKKVINDE